MDRHAADDDPVDVLPCQLLKTRIQTVGEGNDLSASQHVGAVGKGRVRDEHKPWVSCSGAWTLSS